MSNKISITECPRDAMQGIQQFIPTELKIAYLNALLTCDFDVLDFGSFVSAKAIPQLQDTAEVLNKLTLNTNTKLLAIVANERGAITACDFEQISYLGFPFSISEVFQVRNTNATQLQSFDNVKKMQDLCKKYNKKLRVYLSMAFGNPYEETWHEDLVLEWAYKMSELEIYDIALADTIGCSTEENITKLFSLVAKHLPQLQIIAHLHSTPQTAINKLQAALNAGCTHFDVVIKGYGGCPMASDKLTGNIATDILLNTLESKFVHNVNQQAFLNAEQISNSIFLKYH